MSGNGNKNNVSAGKRATRAALSASVQMLLTIAFMLAASALIAAGKLSVEYMQKISMLCVFAATLVGTLLMTSRRGRGLLTTAGMHFAMYLILLLILSVSAGVQRIFNPDFLRTVVCAAAGCALGGTLIAYKNTGRKVKRKRR